MIEARIRKSFPKRPDSAGFELNVDLKTEAGITILFGASGSGKTLTLDSIAGFVRPEEGRIELDGALLFDGETRVHLPPQKRNCGYVFQNYALFPQMTLRENLMFAAERRPRLDRHRKVNEMIERFRLTDVAGRRPHEVSGGQRQRCSIARSLIGEPKLLLLDEPARGLDAPLRGELYDVLRQVRAEFETPILLVTHDLDECFELGELMFILNEGQVVQSGAPREVLEQPNRLEVARLTGLFNLLPCEIKTLDPGRNQSVVRFDEFELQGPYFPGHLKGDRVSLCIRPEQLIAAERNGKPGPNQVPVELLRAIEQPRWMRLEFTRGITVEMSRPGFEALRDAREWVVEFPVSAMRVL
jgi:molybdate transport system ATP-binding protein